ncbi:glutaredoxin-C8 isoform X2 [Ananas comosus]|uniref:Glutaredoxin-C8 isoform X2 n=1 Tax=Ananas comosus TaxID=4615 RepID=A0A6P5G4G5_ANACO|nr:glutaredoxin-C8 isoform X2 [Ananas comosus]
MAAAGRRGLGMATVALLAAAAAVLVGFPSEAATKVSFVKNTIKSHDIVIFSKSYCPYCRRAKGVFKELKKEAYVVELDQREDGSDIQDALSEMVGRRTVPQVFILGEHLGGSDDTVGAYESGKLAELLNIDNSKDDL